MNTTLRLAEQQHDLISREQALAHGMNSNQIGARLRRGTWERTLLDLCGSVHPGRSERALDNGVPPPAPPDLLH